MGNFIEELYYGNINTQERSTDPNGTVQEQMSILADNEAYLTRYLPDDQKRRFIAFSNVWSIVNGESNLDNFIQGFHLGASFVYDIFVSESAPFQDY